MGETQSSADGNRHIEAGLGSGIFLGVAPSPRIMASAGLVCTTPNALGGAAPSQESRIELAICEGLRALKEAQEMDGLQLHADAARELRRSIGLIGTVLRGGLAVAQIAVLNENASQGEAELVRTVQAMSREEARQQHRQALLNSYLA